MTFFSLGQNLNVFFTGLGNRAPKLVCLYALIGAIIFACSLAYVIREQVKGRIVLFGTATLVACVFVNPLQFLPYGVFYQTALLFLMVPFAIVELRWRRLFTMADFALFNVPLWHWSLVYWVGCLNAA